MLAHIPKKLKAKKTSNVKNLVDDYMLSETFSSESSSACKIVVASASANPSYSGLGAKVFFFYNNSSVADANEMSYKSKHTCPGLHK